MRSKFDEQLVTLNNELISMGSLCETIISLAAQALVEGNLTLAPQVNEYDSEIEQKQREIENLCMKMLLQQQPVARDLRTITSALRMVTDMERIGDNSADIAEVVTMAHIRASDETLHIGAMAHAVNKMVTEAVEAFVKQDTALAQKVMDYDDVVDRLFDQVKEALGAHFKNGGDMEYALDLLMIAKYFERIGDHAVNIAGWVLYSISGNLPCPA